MELVNLLEAARRTGISQRTLWAVLTNHLSELGADRRTHKRPSRVGPWEWSIDLEELHALLAKHKPHLLQPMSERPPSASASASQSRAAREALEAQVAALQEQIARLQAQVVTAQPNPPPAPVAPPSADRAAERGEEGASVAVNGRRVRRPARLSHQPYGACRAQTRSIQAISGAP
jgi:hypothetical protein